MVDLEPNHGKLGERLAQTLGRGGFSRKIVKQARTVGAKNFGGFTNPTKTLSYLKGIKKILDEGTQ